MGQYPAVTHVSACRYILMYVIFTYFGWISILEEELYIKEFFLLFNMILNAQLFLHKANWSSN